MNNPPTITDWIQAISAVVTGIIALTAIILTLRTQHAPYRTILRPTSLKLSNGDAVITVQNVGPGYAYQVSVRAVRLRDGKFSPFDNGEYWYKTSSITADGVTEFPAGQSAVFTFGSAWISLEEPIIIIHETVSGKRTKVYWKHHREFKKEVFFRLTKRAVLQYKIKRIYIDIYERIRQRYLSIKFNHLFVETQCSIIYKQVEGGYTSRSPEVPHMLLSSDSLEKLRVETYAFIRDFLEQTYKDNKKLYDPVDPMEVELFDNERLLPVKFKVRKKI